MSRNISLDILKLVMALMVVGLHAGFLGDYSKLVEFLLVNGLFRVAVPVFFIINGYYFYSVLLNARYAEWFKKVFLLYLVWMVLYSYFWFTIPELSFMGFLKLAVSIAFGYCHLWYVSGMLGAATLVVLIKRLPTKVTLSCIGFTFLGGVFIQYIGNYHLLPVPSLDKVFNSTWVYRNFLFLAFPFFCIGYLINKHSIKKYISSNTALLCAALGLVLLVAESYINYIHPLREGGFDNYFSLILVCPAMFILFLNKQVAGNSKEIALYSSSIYFIHFFVLTVLRDTTEYEGTGLTVLTIVISFMASFFIIKLNKRIKFIL